MDSYEIKQVVERVDSQLELLIDDKQLTKMKEEISEIEKMMLDSEFFSNQNKVKVCTTQLGINKSTLELYALIKGRLQDIKEYLQILGNEDDEELISEMNVEVETETNKLAKEYYQLETSFLLSEDYDKNDIILEIHCGAGGTESQDWVEMLYKMYISYAKSKNFKIELLHISPANDIGIKSVTLKISGIYAYGLLKNEKGVHRLVRISPFDSNSKRHTTFALVSTSPVLDEVEDIGINENDLEIDTYRSSGAGGQSVNTTDSAVRILHKPTKIVVTCQNQRSQLQNKQEALNVLKSKLIELELERKRQEVNGFKGEVVDVNFGSQIRTYVFHPYAMVKDHRSNFEQSSPSDVLSGELDEIIISVLRINKGR